MQGVLYEVRQGVAYLTLNRDERRNALSLDIILQLNTAFEEITKDTAIKAVLLRSVGKAFCAGADLVELKAMQAASLEESLKHSHAWKECFLKMYHCPKIIVAQVQGPAIAGGCGLVALCDFVLANEQASFGCPEVRIGFVPAIIMFFLMQKVGVNWAREMVLSGNTLSAQRALAIGMVNQLIQGTNLGDAAEDFVRDILKRNSSYAMQLSKQIWQKLQEMPMKEGIVYATEANAMARSSQDCKQGVAHFLRKEKINWSNILKKH